ncbi:Ig-like domain-containing protein [Adhaeribacter rhizoryzae]|uniref:T9SS type A sorting domain-containing protein n=1 Tax=Adhaeribacter rhizoryzae TaxID=2607907 RepID=A0A5M6DCR0_9BACT|nr:T9SS type A sorting domain-containing protein [Adhaeribacter rhizoryzae]KAA5542945.1 T9SS type A sorting domain-containing protein [Adhaeribacter rhizoryzae]
MIKTLTKQMALTSQSLQVIKRISFALLLFVLWYGISINNLLAQPTKQWDKSFGGSGYDELKTVQQTSDGGYILGGNSKSKMSGYKSEDSGESFYGDFWIVKLNAAGEKEWDNTLGGIGTNNFTAVYQTTDGGYIVGGSSLSNAGRDKTQNSKGLNDFWIIKLDAQGNKVWDKTIGSPADDLLWTIKPTRDGGYILGGETQEAAGGDKTGTPRGNYDFWVVKLNAVGSKEWDKVIGGNSYDILRAIDQTTDGGYILGGLSTSEASGDKSQNSKAAGSTNAMAAYDYWVVKINASGIKEWDKTIGGNGLDDFRQVIQTKDGGYIVGGESNSTISGDKSENPYGGIDCWLVKLDASGTKEWDKTIGMYSDEYLRDLQQTADGGYILGRTDPAYTGVGNDYFLLKLDASRNIEWEKYVIAGGPLGSFRQTADGGYIIGGSSNYNIVLASKGDYDYWVFKLSPATAERSIKINNAFSSGYCTDTLVPIYFTTTGTFNPGETFIAQLSDATGSFSSPITIGTSQGSPIAATIPANINSGKGYRIRIVSSLTPAVVSSDNGTDIGISKMSTLSWINIEGPMEPCAGTTVTYSFTDLIDLSHLFWSVPYDWTVIGRDSNKITVKVGNTHGLVSVMAQNFCGLKLRGELSVFPVVVPSEPGIITASATSVCAGDTVVYSTSSPYEPSLQNRNLFNWTVPAGWTILNEKDITKITVKVGTGSGFIRLIIFNQCGVSPEQRLAVSSSGPAAPTVTSKTICGPGAITLTASGAPTTGSYRWFTSSTGGTPITNATSATFTTPVLSTTTTYYVSVVNGTCESARVPVTATVNPLPKILVATNATTITSGGTATLTASGASTYTWSPVTGLSSTTGATVTAKPTATTTYTVTGTDVNGCSGTASITITVNTSGLQMQTITFPPIADKVYGDAPFTLNATASSGLSLYYKIISGPATVSGKTLTITGVGTVTVRAYHPGNDRYLAATPVDVSFNVRSSAVKQSQTISFAALVNKEYGDAPFTVSATASSGLPVSFSVVAGGATISGNTVTLIDSGMVTIRASQAGNANYLAAPNVDRSFRVWGPAKMSQSISFAALPTKTYGDAPFTLSAAATSGLPVSFNILSGPATITGNTLTINGAGIITVRATQAGSGTYHTATPVDQSFTVNKASQSITFMNLVDKTYGDGPIYLVANASSGLPVSYRVVSGPASITGNILTLTGAGTVTVQAEQGGNTNYLAANAVPRSFTVIKANQTVVLATIADKTYGDAPFTLSATASSGLSVTYSIVSGPATISNNTVTLTGVGTVTVRATQVGNTNYNPAAADKSFTVKSAGPTPFPPFTCSLAHTSKVTQAEPWFGMWGPSTGAGAIDLTVSGGTTPYTYQWSNGLSSQDVAIAAPGTYTVKVTDARGCTAITIVTVGRKNDPIRLAASQINVSTTSGQDGSIDLSVVGGIAPFTYRWSNGATTEDLTGLAAGTYTVTVTDAFGQKVSISVQILSPGQGILAAVKNPDVSEEILVNENILLVYPNPAKDQTTVNFTLATTGYYTLDLFDIRGAKIKTIVAGQALANKSFDVKLKVNDLAEGVYLLKLVTDKGVGIQRISVKR